MLKQYKIINILLPIKPETRKAFKGIVKKLSNDFGGVTYNRPHIPSEVKGIWIDPQTSKITKDNHISLVIGADSSNGIKLNSYFSQFKKDLEHKLNESLIWILVMDVVRVA